MGVGSSSRTDNNFSIPYSEPETITMAGPVPLSASVTDEPRFECEICLNLLNEEAADLEEESSYEPQPPKRPKQDVRNSDLQATSKSEICCTPCGHVFHKVCMLSWIKKKSKNGRVTKHTGGTCPKCFKPLTSFQLTTIYLSLQEPDSGGDDEGNWEEEDGNEDGSLSEQINNLKEENEKLKNELEERKTKVKELETKVEELETKVEELETKVEEMETKVEEMETKVEEMETKVEEMETKVEELTTEVEERKQQVEKLRGEAAKKPPPKSPNRKIEQPSTSGKRLAGNQKENISPRNLRSEFKRTTENGGCSEKKVEVITLGSSSESESEYDDYWDNDSDYIPPS